MVERQCGVRRSRFTTARQVKRLKWSKKKAFRTVKHTPSAQIVESFCDGYLTADDDDIICVDEAGFYIGDIPGAGYAPVGTRLNVPTSRTLRRSKLTLICAISKHGIVHYEIMDHNCRKTDFLKFVENMPTKPGSKIVMDNISFHHSKEVTKLLEDKSCRAVYTPPYSPRFNAIEYVFSLMKRRYRSECPSFADDGYDYVGTLQAVVTSLPDMTPYMDHVKRLVVNTSVEPLELYSGYDR